MEFGDGYILKMNEALLVSILYDFIFTGYLIIESNFIHFTNYTENYK